MRTDRFASAPALRSFPWVCCLAALLTGCLSRPALVHETFALHPSIGLQNTNSSPHGVLVLRTVQVCPLFEGRCFVYRVGADLYEADRYAEFLVPPNRALAIALRACLRTSGLFADVLEPGSQLAADTVLEVHAFELYGDFRKPAPPAAVLAVRLLLFNSEKGPEQKLLLRKDYARRVILNEATASALVTGWNQALTEIMSEASLDIAAVHPELTAR